MTTQNYLQIENNLVTNIVVWNGNKNLWQPPENATMLIAADIISKTWFSNYYTDPYSWELKEILNFANIGFTWDGLILTTNQPMPIDPPKLIIPAFDQPTSIGTTTI